MENDHLKQAEQEAIEFAETVADATEDSAQPEPLDAPGKEQP